jgi:hypothetical protein
LGGKFGKSCWNFQRTLLGSIKSSLILITNSIFKFILKLIFLIYIKHLSFYHQIKYIHQK